MLVLHQEWKAFHVCMTEVTDEIRPKSNARQNAVNASQNVVNESMLRWSHNHWRRLPGRVILYRLSTSCSRDPHQWYSSSLRLGFPVTVPRARPVKSTPCRLAFRSRLLSRGGVPTGKRRSMVANVSSRRSDGMISLLCVSSAQASGT